MLEHWFGAIFPAFFGLFKRRSGYCYLRSRMTALKTVVALCGSTRTSSINRSLIETLAKMAKERFSVVFAPNLIEIPAFSPDFDTNSPPEAIIAFRKCLRSADGILICTPEYAMGVPGMLKNAIDWTVSSMEFSKKPTALITASSVGEKGHRSLLETLEVIEAKILPETQVLISFVKTKINPAGEITEAPTKLELERLLVVFDGLMRE